MVPAENGILQGGRSVCPLMGGQEVDGHCLARRLYASACATCKSPTCRTWERKVSVLPAAAAARSIPIYI